MNNLLQYLKLIFPALFIISALFGLTGCVEEKIPADQTNIGEEGNACLIVKVRAAEPYVSLSDNEKMHTLRVILLDDKGKMEQNEFREFSSPEEEEEIMLMTVAGNKKVFLIANEEAVGSYFSETIELDNSLTFPEFLNGLDGYEGNCGDLLNSLCFDPQFPREPGYQGRIPQTSCYSVELKAGETRRKTMFVVKTAVKVDFTFKNFRNDKVRLNQVRISSFADITYLLGQVGNGDFTKDGEYWVDWLQKTSLDSQSYPEYEENEDFNTARGWISDYRVPEDASHSLINFITGGSWEIEPQKTIDSQQPEPTVLYKGPYYFPESKNLSSSGNQQQYYLSLTIVDSSQSSENPGSPGAAEEKTFTISRGLPNAKGLFRNSHLDIEVNMSEGATDIYVEIKSWNQGTEVFGALEQEN